MKEDVNEAVVSSAEQPMGVKVSGVPEVNSASSTALVTTTPSVEGLALGTLTQEGLVYQQIQISGAQVYRLILRKNNTVIKGDMFTTLYQFVVQIFMVDIEFNSVLQIFLTSFNDFCILLHFASYVTKRKKIQ